MAFHRTLSKLTRRRIDARIERQRRHTQRKQDVRRVHFARLPEDNQATYAFSEAVAQPPIARSR